MKSKYASLMDKIEDKKDMTADDEKDLVARSRTSKRQGLTKARG
jgi:hypothetical protein